MGIEAEHLPQNCRGHGSDGRPQRTLVFACADLLRWHKYHLVCCALEAAMATQGQLPVLYEAKTNNNEK